MFYIKIMDHGREPYFMMVFGADRERRRAMFDCLPDALEACRVIQMMRCDSVFEGTEVVELYGEEE